jgi:hypothetical protein
MDQQPPRAAFFVYGATLTTQAEMQSDIAENEKRIEVHEAVCAERYKGIQDSLSRGETRMNRTDKKLQRIEYVLYFLLVAVIGGRDIAIRIFELFAK